MKEVIEVHKNMISGETEIKTLYFIRATRESICMGDDVTAPNADDISYEKSDKLSDFLDKLMNGYLNIYCGNCRWKITANKKTLGYITYSPEDAKYELAIPDDYIINLNIKSVHCSKREN